MLLSILPDIDIIFRLAGVELGHRTITHSAIIWLAVGIGIISFLKIKCHRGSQAAVYLIAYLSHLIIGDILVGPINVLYPFGEFVINSPIKGAEYFLLEAVVFISMASVVLSKYYSFKKKNEDTFLFRYHSKIDAFLYPVLILALIVSFFYVLVIFDLNIMEAAIIAPVHFAAVCILVLMWRASKTQRQLVSHQ